MVFLYECVVRDLRRMIEKLCIHCLGYFTPIGCLNNKHDELEQMRLWCINNGKRTLVIQKRITKRLHEGRAKDHVQQTDRPRRDFVFVECIA